MALDHNTFAIVLLLSPFAAACLAQPIARETGRAAGWILAVVPAGICIALVMLLPAVSVGTPVRLSIDWVPSLSLNLSFLVDGLSLVFAVLVTGIGAFILIYSGDYLIGHPQRGRFLAITLAFMGAMLGLVLADSLVALFAFWELTSVTSFLLIGFDAERQEARRAAIQALIVTGVGGLALLAGGVSLSLAADSWNLSTALHIGDSFHFNPSYPAVLGLMLVAAFTKSAQFPFHFWLPDAMEAPTPVSAYLHSATMVQAGVYLLARLSPILDGTVVWQCLLCGIGGVTLLWGGLGALHQVDLKQILARTTLAALGLLVLMLGIGGAAAALGVAAYFVAHALYKGGLFLVAGIIDQQTGTRNPHALGGLRDSLAVSFIAAALGGLSMLGIPPLIGYFAKEEIYAALGSGETWMFAILAVVVVGNALIGAAGLIVVLRPFMGALKPTPLPPTEAPVALLAGPVTFGLLGLAVIFAISSYGENILAPMASAIAGESVVSHLGLAVDLLGPAIWLSVVTWVLAVLLYLRLDRLRAALELMDRRITWRWDHGFDALMATLVTSAGRITRVQHNGRLEIYLLILVGSVALSVLVPMAWLNAWPIAATGVALSPYEWGLATMSVVGVAAVVASRTRLGSVAALGIQGLALALIFIVFGAPDLGFTQLMVEVLSVVVIALVMARLDLAPRDPRRWEDWIRDGTLAVVAAGSVTVLLVRVVAVPFDPQLSDFFEANAWSVAHGRNIVNVILVDFRGLDTLGEISVVLTAGIAVLALLRGQKRAPPDGELRPPREDTTA